MKAAIYCRLFQNPSLPSIETQQLLLLRTLLDQGYDLYAIYVDNSMNPARPSFQQMVKDAKAGYFDEVFSYSPPAVPETYD